jgi:DNA-binding IclR family transcriptional regulator
LKSSNEDQKWRFFSNHLEVLLYVGRHPDARLRTVAEEVGITERAAHRILNQLSEEGYVQVRKEGRRNHYRVVSSMTLRHRANRGVPLQPLLDIINPLAEDLNPQE